MEKEDKKKNLSNRKHILKDVVIYSWKLTVYQSQDYCCIPEVHKTHLSYVMAKNKDKIRTWWLEKKQKVYTWKVFKGKFSSK